ncbi:MAG: hypothetical protein ABFD25_22685 [Clostridiaceae bacterium]
MKRILFCFLVAIMTVMMLVTVVYAADSPPDPKSIGDYFTWEFLGTMAGAVAATTLVTQFCKFPLDKVWKIPTRFVVYGIALLILFAVEFFTGTITTDKVILTMLNAIIVTAAAMGTYEATFKKLENRSRSG